MAFGATILDAEGPTLTRDEKAFFRDADPYGFIIFARNVETPDQLRGLCAEMRAAVGRDAVITVDQEGGRVQRLRAPHWREHPAPQHVVDRAGKQAARAMYLTARLIADELHRVGIDSSCAPMVDVRVPQTHDFLADRCYGTDPGTVARLGRAVADGLLDGGVLPVLKHMPGHGRATADSHFDLPHVAAGLEELQPSDFAPFRALNDLPMGMTAHLVYEAIDPAPATLSPAILRLIRDDIGFDNLIMTDDISMKALGGALPDIARASLAAGCDVVLLCNAALTDRVAVAEAAGRMDAAAQTRAERALAMRKPPEDIDIPALEAELAALLGGALHG